MAASGALERADLDANALDLGGTEAQMEIAQGEASSFHQEEWTGKCVHFEEEAQDEEELLRFSEGLASTVTYNPDKVVAAVNAGGPYIAETSLGIAFLEDNSFSGGDVLRTGEDIVDAQEPSLYRTARYGDVTYSFYGLSCEDYYVDIHFAEIVFTDGPRGMRIFDVYIQDEKVVSELDVYERVGSNRPLILLNVRTTVLDGTLTISFRGVVGNPTISAICIHKAPPLGSAADASCVSSLPLSKKRDEVAHEDRRLTSSRHQQIKDKARGLVRDYEQKLDELKNECYEAWISVQDTNRQAEKLRNELSVKSLTVDTLANVVENQVAELKELREKEGLEKENLRKLVGQARDELKDIKGLYNVLAEEAKESICSFPDPREMISAIQSMLVEHQDLKKRYWEERQERKHLYNKVIELRGNVRVFCRCRPLGDSEVAAASHSVVEFDSARENELVVRSGGNTRKLFKFDRVFTPEDGQSEVFADTAPVVTSVLDGYNVCIFAYGQTGTGKTFTMEGIPENRGVNYRTLEELFRIAGLRKAEVNFEIAVSVLEVYNEQIRDLLAPAAQGQASKKLEIKQVAEGGHHVPGLLEASVHSMAEVWEVLQTGSSARAVESTNANEHSSRSHCMLCVKVKGESLITGECTRSKLWLVDLAGSERVAKTDVHGDRLKEAQSINKSLAALGDVIHALTTKSSHVPYRNSKLTHLLQDSLGGESKTLMFVQISPTEADVSETLCSLNFATRVRGLELGPAKKQLDSAEFVKYKQIAEKARQDVKSKDDSAKKLEESLKVCENKLKTKEQLCQSLLEKVRERDRVAAELELQLANEKKARLAAEAALKDKRLKAAKEGAWDRADAEEALEAALKTAAAFPRQPLQDRTKDFKLAANEDTVKGTIAESTDNENVDPQRPDSASRKLSLGRMKMVPSRFNSPPVMSTVAPRRTGRASTIGTFRRTSLVPAPPKFVLETPKFSVPKLSELQKDVVTTQDAVQADYSDPVAAWKGVDVPGTLNRVKQLRRVHFSSPLMRSREKLLEAKREGGMPQQKAAVAGARMRRVSLVARSWSKLPGGGLGGAQRIPSGRKGQMHQRERGWNKA